MDYVFSLLEGGTFGDQMYHCRVGGMQQSRATALGGFGALLLAFDESNRMTSQSCPDSKT